MKIEGNEIMDIKAKKAVTTKKKNRIKNSSVVNEGISLEQVRDFARMYVSLFVKAS